MTNDGRCVGCGEILTKDMFVDGFCACGMDVNTEINEDGEDR